MPIDNIADPRAELYLDFKRKLASRDIDIFYDNDDLLDIYTYADDEGDSYVMLEAVNLASRLYPGSEEFMLRKALTLDMLGFYEEARLQADAVQSGSTYARLVKLRLGDGMEASARLEMLERIIADATTLDEDDIIQISEITRLAGGQARLVEMMETIKEKAEYTPTLFYEIALNSAEEGLFQVAMRMAEELVDAEPMKRDFWEMYAEIAYNMVDYDKAISGADFALAIDENSERAKLIKGCAMLMKGEREEGRELVGNSYLDSRSANPHAACLLALSYIDDRMKAAKVLTDYIVECGNLSKEPLTTLAVIDGDTARPFVEEYVSSFVTLGEGALIEWASELYAAGAVETAARVIDRYVDLTPAKSRTIVFEDLWFQYMYQAEMYERVVERFEQVEDFMSLYSLSGHLACIMSLVRLGQKERALKRAVEFRAQEAVHPMIDYRTSIFDVEMRLTYLRVTLDKIISALRAEYSASGHAVGIDEYDPFISHRPSLDLPF